MTQRVLLAGTFGFALGLAPFAVTAPPSNWGGVGPCIVPDSGTVEVEWERHDPWTGQPMPRTYACDPDGPGPIAAETHELDLLAGMAIPVPVGAVLGFGFTWLLLAAVAAARHSPGRRIRDFDAP